MAAAIVGAWSRAQPRDGGGVVLTFPVAFLADDGRLDLDEIEVTILSANSGNDVEKALQDAVKARATTMGYALPKNAAVLHYRVGRGG